jgi:hypothetical protein
MANRLKLGMILILFEVISDYFLKLAPSGDLYYLIAGAFSFLIIPVIAQVGKDQLVIDLLELALLVLITQFIGFIIYHTRLPVTIYNYAIYILLILQILRLMLKRGGDGVDQHNNFVHLLCCPNFKRGRNIC